jgi:hypothetical protein
MLKYKEKFGNSMFRNKKLDQQIILKLNFFEIRTQDFQIIHLIIAIYQLPIHINLLESNQKMMNFLDLLFDL